MNNDTGQPAIDWKKVRRRLEAAQASLDSGFIQTAVDKNKILKARARTLAQRTEEEEPGQEYLEVLEFTLAYESYAIESARVSEVYPLTEITPLPGMPPFVAGIVNVRGEILCVIDIKKFFELPERGITDLNKIIIVQDGNIKLGILADAVAGIRKLDVGELETELPTLTGIRARYLKGVTRECMAVLDATKILSDEDIVILKGRQTK
jgi:purine-binding chemotaxis protein CheW